MNAINQVTKIQDLTKLRISRNQYYKPALKKIKVKRQFIHPSSINATRLSRQSHAQTIILKNISKIQV